MKDNRFALDCRRWLMVGAVLLPFLLVGRAWALDPAKSIFQFNCQNWTPQNGLPVVKINTVAQTRDGYIWLGTQSGLVRFDGLEFKVVPIGLLSFGGQEVRALALTKNGSLVFAINFGGFGSYNEDNFSAFGDARWSQPRMGATTVFAARDGAIWTGANLGDGRWVETNPAASFFGSTNTGVDLAICEDAAGQMWLGTPERGLFYWAHGKFALFPNELLKHENIFAVAVDAGNQVWVGTGRGLNCYDTNGVAKAIPSVYNEVTALLVDRHGIMWVGTHDMGVARYANGKFEYLRKADGLASDHVTSLFEDAEGSLWVGTLDGLSELTDLKFPTLTSNEGLGQASGHTVAAAKSGGLWAATDTGLAYFDGRTFTNYIDQSLVPNAYIKVCFEARNGDIYLSDGEKNLNVFSKKKLLARFPCPNWPEAFAEDSQSVLAAVGDTLFRIQGGKMVPYEYKGGLKPACYWILNLCVAKDGAIWVASNNGIFRVQNGAFKQWGMADGLSGRDVYWISDDVDGSIWAGLLTGITRIKNGMLKNIRAKDGLPDEQIYAIIPDDLGFFWCDCRRGIFRVRRQSLNDFADGKAARVECELFEGLESLKSADRTDQRFSGCKTLDGRIWFPCPWGVVMVDPAHIPVNQIAPPVHIESVLANGQEYARTNNAVAPPGRGDLEIHFTALSFIVPQGIHFRYQLLGYDKDWVATQGRRQAFYTNLKPGRYTFRVVAANADGVWNLAGDAITIELRPHYYQTVWFDLFWVVLAGAGLTGIYAWRIQQLHRRHWALQESRNQLEKEVQNRTAELAYERDLLRTLMENSPDHIYFKDTQSCFIKSGHALARECGVATPAEMVGKSDFDFFTEERARPFFEDEQQIIRTGEPIVGKIERQIWKFGHRETWMLSSKMPLRNNAGEIIGTFGISKDVTALKQTENQLSYERDLLKALMDNFPDSIYFKDLQSRFVRVSKSKLERNFATCLAQHRAGSGKDELPVHLASLEQFSKYLLGRTDFDFLPETIARLMFEDEQEIIRTGKPITGRIVHFTNLDGAVGWTLSTKMVWRDRDGNTIGTFGNTKDITAIKKAEAELESTHKRLLEISRQAGMAEVATSVLHNVGNVLNSVNISAALVAENARKSKVSYLVKVVALLDEHAADLGGFMTDDPKGRQLPGYLSQLASHLVGEQEQAIQELDLIRQNIEHIKHIVAMQQGYVRISGVTETVRVPDLIEEALCMSAGALDPQELELVREFAEAPPVTLEKHRVLQILVNLISNARHACDDSGRKDKKLTLQISRAEGGVWITVRDNGVGIPPENLTRIFSHGFTTRKGGHGFGLHSGALAAKELGGSLTVHSDGPGQGAAFTLEIPLEPQPA